MMTDIELSYIAGILDGEGWIGWHNEKRVLASGETGHYRYPRIEVSMTTHIAIDLMHQLFGGTIRYRDNYKRKRSPTWTVIFSSQQVRQVLLAVRPFLREKTKAADELLAYFEEQK